MDIPISNAEKVQVALHPHLHCLVPTGGISITNRWIASKYKGNYLFPVKAMSKVFRGKFMAAFKRLCKQHNITLDQRLLNKLYQHNWVVYSKAPYKTVASVLEYLARYTNRIAISNHRITNISETCVSFSYKDYRNSNKRKIMTLSGVEFLRRFSMHILPKGFVRVRHFGFLANAQRNVLFNIKIKLGVQIKSVQKNAKPVMTCPICKHEMICIETIAPKRGPPLEQIEWNNIIRSYN